MNYIPSTLNEKGAKRLIRCIKFYWAKKGYPEPGLRLEQSGSFGGYWVIRSDMKMGLPV